MGKLVGDHQIIGYKSPIDGTGYSEGDTRLIGQGVPPADPAFARQHPGAGRLELQRQLVDVADVDPDHRPPESAWIPKASS